MEKVKVVCPTCSKINQIPKKESYTKANCGACKNSLLLTTPKELTQESFDYEIVNSDLPIIVDFYAPWCQPCKMMAPIFERVSSKYPLKVRFAKVNTEVEQTLGSTYNIRSIPTLVIYKNGIEVHRVSGAIDESQLTYLANSFL